MKAFYIHLLMTVSAVVFQAEELSGQSPFELMHEAFSDSCVELKCSYEMSFNGIVTKGEALLFVQGEAYRMSGDGLDVFCDSRSVWTLDMERKEAVVEPAADLASNCYSASPALMFVRISDMFDISGVSSSAGKWTYSLSAKEKCDIKKADIIVTSAGIVLSGTFLMSDSTVLKADVLSMHVMPKKDPVFFRPGIHFDSSWAVTDLR